MKKSFSMAFLVFLFFSSCQPVEKENLNVFRYNESRGIVSLDPAFARDLTMIWPDNQLYNGLVQMDRELNILPCIASSWEISEDGRIYTFQLRKDVFFHEHSLFGDQGTRMVDARDFVFSFGRILNKDLASPGFWIFGMLDRTEEYPGFHAVNDSVFQIRLKQSFPPFLGILTMPYCFVVPREIADHPDFDLSSNPVGTGPFFFKLWKRDEKLILLKNPRYFEKDSAGKSLPYLDGVSISFIRDKQSEFLEFLMGNIDFLSGLHAVYKDELTTVSGNLNPEYKGRFIMETQAYLNTEYLGILSESPHFNVKDSPLGNRDFRKALNFGFQRDKMLKYLRNNMGYPALNGFLPAGLPFHDHKNIHGFTYNPDSVRYYLDKAGYGPDDMIPEITLTTTSDYLDICEFIQYELSVFGIRVKLDIATGGAYRNKLANGHLIFFRGSWIADYPDPENYLSLFYSPNKSPAGPNYTQFDNPVYDSIYQLSLQTRDPATRTRLNNEMDSYLIENALIIPLYYDKVVRFYPEGIKNLSPSPLNSLVLKEVYKVQ